MSLCLEYKECVSDDAIHKRICGISASLFGVFGRVRVDLCDGYYDTLDLLGISGAEFEELEMGRKVDIGILGMYAHAYRSDLEYYIDDLIDISVEIRGTLSWFSFMDGHDKYILEEIGKLVDNLIGVYKND